VRVTLADLIDVEAQLARDREAEPAALAARDRALVPGAEPDDAAPGRRAALLSRWVGALRTSAPPARFPGARAERALALLRLVLAAAGLALGWGTAAALLRFEGGHPVNVWNALLVFVFLQLALLLVLALSLAGARGRAAPWLGPLRAAVGAAFERLAGGRAGRARALWGMLRSRRSLYHHLEPWLLLGLTQVFGVLFNVGALLGLLRTVAFTDVAFGWSTTLVELDPSRFHALVHALALPWRWLWPSADPGPALVEATRYSHLSAAYVTAGRAADPAQVGGWWPFLAAALATYGLLPRLATLALASWRARTLVRRLPLDDAEVTRAVRRLTEPRVETRAPVPEAAPPPLAGGVPASLAPAPGGRCALVLWRDVPGGPVLERLVAAQTQRPVAAVAAADGTDAAAPGWDAALGAAEPVVVVAEAFEAPDRGALRLLAELREAVGPRRHVLVLLVDAVRGLPRPARPEDLVVWRDGLAHLADPYLAVEPLRGAGAA
jgi:hypothetical protein